jgi:asparagine synthase (glutamine-hydrolysing)
MCGIFAGVSANQDLGSAAKRALDHMVARGPDGEGLWHEQATWLGHRRLAILDLTNAGAQPMASACGRYVITFNGEIYNFRALRKDLEERGVRFRTGSDTELLVELFARDGAAMLASLHGMFAFVIWDRLEQRGFATRDPYGIKPLYIAQCPQGVLLASQVKALIATGLVSRDPDSAGQAGFWLLGSVPDPLTWYRDIRAVPAGSFVHFSAKGAEAPMRWCDLGEIWRNPGTHQGDTAAIFAATRAALDESVQRHMVSDVPVGVFLSGGIDSGAVAGLMAQHAREQIAGFTIHYAEYAGSTNDELPGARLIADHYGIRHHPRLVTQSEFLDDVPRILAAMDQPSIDGVNSWFAAKAVAEAGLKVAVSGAGGDELFHGYPSFRQLPAVTRLWRNIRPVPGARLIAELAGRALARRSGIGRWRHLPDWLNDIGSAWWLKRSLFTPEDLPSLMGEALAAVASPVPTPAEWLQTTLGPLASNAALAVSQLESALYMGNQILRDCDWASMAHSVELRTPLVDAHLLTQMQPLLGQLSAFPGKTLLAAAPENPLPAAIATKAKTGFTVPLDRWMASLTDPAPTRETTSMGWARFVAAAYDRGT